MVLDPFMGSGTTAVAAQRLHRQFIGFEIVPEFHQGAVQRLSVEGGAGNVVAPNPLQPKLLEKAEDEYGR